MKKIISGFTLFFASIIGFAQPQAYYNGIDFDLNGQPLKNVLATRITNTHTNNLSYGDVWVALKVTDLNPSNSNQVMLIYGHTGVSSGKFSRVRAKNDNGGANLEWNREHVYARSLGTPNLEQSIANADAHHVRSSDVQLNGDRGNKKFTSGSGNSGSVGSNWYPGDEWKGDVARMMMYMYLRYPTQCSPTNVAVGTIASSFDNMIGLFLQWNTEDPVSQLEIQRNTYLANANNSAGQGNRNPFIDNPYLATKIWGGPEAEDRWNIALSNDNFDNIEFGIYPNPATDNKVNIQTSELINTITIHSIDGKLIQQISNPQFENNQFEINNLSTGFYIITLKSDNKSTAKKLIVK